MTTQELTELTKRKTVELYEAIQQKSRFKLILVGGYNKGVRTSKPHLGWLNVAVDLGVLSLVKPDFKEHYLSGLPDGCLEVRVRYWPENEESGGFVVAAPIRRIDGGRLTAPTAAEVAEAFDAFVLLSIFDVAWSQGSASAYENHARERRLGMR